MQKNQQNFGKKDATFVKYKIIIVFKKTLFVEFRKYRMCHGFCIEKKNYRQRKVRMNELLMPFQYYTSPLNSAEEKKVFL